MMSRSVLVDTDVLPYLLSFDVRKADIAEELLSESPSISIRVLSESIFVAGRKLNIDWPGLDEMTGTLRKACAIEPLTLETCGIARRLSRRYRLAWYDALIASSAVLAGCTPVYSEDFQHGRLIEDHMKVVDPFITS